jgi:hypothetical protein
MSKITWPAWFSSADGKKSQIFKDAADVPAGWTSGAEKLTVDGKAEKPAPVAKVADAPAAGTAETDAAGHTFDPALHTGTKTKAGLWRMKVGVARPAPILDL